eukprot:7916238-Pyramimonas_sp.AAC.2
MAKKLSKFDEMQSLCGHIRQEGLQGSDVEAPQKGPGEEGAGNEEPEVDDEAGRPLKMRPAARAPRMQLGAMRRPAAAPMRKPAAAAPAKRPAAAAGSDPNEARSQPKMR